MTDTKQKVAELATKFFGKGGVRLYTTGLLAMSAFGLTACGTMGQQGTTYAMAMPVNGGNTAGQAPAAAQPIILVQPQPSATYYVNEALTTVNSGVQVAGNAVGVLNSFKLGDAQAYAIKTNAKANYNSKTINAIANLTRAKGQAKSSVIRARGQASRDVAYGQAALKNSGGRGGKTPRRTSHANHGQTNPRHGSRGR